MTRLVSTRRPHWFGCYLALARLALQFNITNLMGCSALTLLKPAKWSHDCCFGLGTAGQPEFCERRLPETECRCIGASCSSRQIISVFAMSAFDTGPQPDPLHRRKAVPSPLQTRDFFRPRTRNNSLPRTAHRGAASKLDIQARSSQITGCNDRVADKHA